MNPNLEQFEAVLRDYHPSEQAMELLKDLKLVILAGPSGTGRNSVIDRLVASGNYHFIISDTTRKPRINNGVLEENGVNYWFRSEEDFLNDLKAGAFLEAEIIHQQQVSGISIRELEKTHASGKIAINEVEIGGFAHILELKPDTTGVILLPPSFEEWIRRYFDRSQLPFGETIRRMNTGIRIFNAVLSNDQFQIVINDQLDRVVSEVDALAHGKGVPNNGRALAQELLEKTQDFIRAHQASSGTLDS